MDGALRIEQALATVLGETAGTGNPPRLAAAMRYAVFPGGARIRPRLCLAVAQACGEDHPEVTDRAASAIELLHCASLVHDDMPCFDDAPTRRGKPSVHRAYGERLAVLTGDALIVLAFESLARVGAIAPARLVPLLQIVGRAVGAPNGIVAGQAWECEPFVSLKEYHRSKTGAMFSAATQAGAAAAGADPSLWVALGESLGEAYQVADDLRDAAGDPEALGKPVGRDEALGRPSAVGELGLSGAIDRLEQLLAGVMASIPPCPGSKALREHIMIEARSLLPEGLARRAA